MRITNFRSCSLLFFFFSFFVFVLSSLPFFRFFLFFYFFFVFFLQRDIPKRGRGDGFRCCRQVFSRAAQQRNSVKRAIVTLTSVVLLYTFCVSVVFFWHVFRVRSTVEKYVKNLDSLFWPKKSMNSERVPSMCIVSGKRSVKWSRISVNDFWSVKRIFPFNLTLLPMIMKPLRIFVLSRVASSLCSMDFHLADFTRILRLSFVVLWFRGYSIKRCPFWYSLTAVCIFILVSWHFPRFSFRSFYSFFSLFLFFFVLILFYSYFTKR